MDSKSWTRRAALIAPAAVAVAANVPPLFTAEDRRWLAALCDHIIPADQAPGAVAAGALVFLERQLAGMHHRFLPHYREGLVAIKASAPEFLQWPFDEQFAFLQKLEKGEVTHETWKLQSGAAFWSMLIEHTMESYYGDPSHGGNKGMASWHMLGIADRMH